MVPYHPHAFSPRGRFAVLNDKHSYFLLVDNGTVGRYGADIILRKRFEEFISKQTIESKISKALRLNEYNLTNCRQWKAGTGCLRSARRWNMYDSYRFGLCDK